jgi:predicted transcriptional regulator
MEAITEGISLQELKQSVHKALKQWHHPEHHSSSLSQLSLFQHNLRACHGIHKRATNAMLLQGLETLEKHYMQDAVLLRRAFLDNELNRILAVERDISEATLYRHIDAALARLVECLIELEADVHAGLRSALLQRLELPTYTGLIAVDEHVARLEEILTDGQQPWLVSLEGMGGIGKTSLADATVRSLIEQGRINGVAWVTARQSAFSFSTGIREVDRPTLSVEALAEGLVNQLMPDESIPPHRILPVLQEFLKDNPHVIVIDNLETVADVEALLATLRMLTDPTKFLLTSRASLFAEPDVFTFSVPQLSKDNAVRLLRQEAAQRNLARLQNASDEDLHSIYTTVGGNPLALRLVAGQTHVHTLETVLESLHFAHGRKIEELYTYIYREAWDQLDEMTRHVFLAMPLVTSYGAPLAQLSEVTGLSANDIVEALEILVRLNLVDSSDQGDEQRFTIHSLTRTFLHEQVLAW